MPTINDTIRQIADRLTEAGSESPRLDAEILVRHVLGLDRTHLLMALPDDLPPDVGGPLDAFVQRRIMGEPISLLIGRRAFFDLEFVVTSDVLTPRPETELLVEWALGWLEQHPGTHVVDVGTGSGAIAIAVASRTAADVRVLALDISSDALAVARINAGRLAPGRITFAESDLLAALEGPVNLILANLPYLTPDQLQERRELAFEPELALVSGADGLDAIRRLIRQLAERLAVPGAVGLELDPEQAQVVAGLLAEALPGATVAIHDDLSGRARMVSAIRL